MSLVVKILILFWFLNSFRLTILVNLGPVLKQNREHLPHVEQVFLARLAYRSTLLSSITLTKILISSKVLEKSSEVMLAFLQISSLCLSNSLNLEFRV